MLQIIADLTRFPVAGLLFLHPAAPAQDGSPFLCQKRHGFFSLRLLCGGSPLFSVQKSHTFAFAQLFHTLH